MKMRIHQINLVKGLIILLTFLTAGIHFSLNFAMNKVDLLFTLNGLGYLGILSFYLFSLENLVRFSRWLRIIFIGFTVLTIILWVFLGKPYTVIGTVDKFIEMLLVIFLVLDRPNFD